jgi:hypothetical protein
LNSPAPQAKRLYARGHKGINHLRELTNEKG